MQVYLVMNTIYSLHIFSQTQILFYLYCIFDIKNVSILDIYIQIYLRNYKIQFSQMQRKPYNPYKKYEQQQKKSKFLSQRNPFIYQYIRNPIQQISRQNTHLNRQLNKIIYSDTFSNNQQVDTYQKRYTNQKVKKIFDTNQLKEQQQFKSQKYHEWIEIDQKETIQSQDQQIIHDDILSKILLNFESPSDISEGKSIYIGNIFKQFDENYQRILKKQIKQFLKDDKIKGIYDLSIEVDEYYPKIILSYKINNKIMKTNLVQIFKKNKVDDRYLLSIFRKMFLKFFIELKSESIIKLYPFIEERIYLNKVKFNLFVKENKHISNCNLACMSTVNNKKIIFYFIDSEYNCLQFTNVFIQNYKQNYPQGYAYYTKYIKKDFIVNQIKEDNYGINNQQISSDDQPKYESQINLDQVKKKIEELLSDKLSDYQSKVEKKEQIYQKLRQDVQKNQDQLAKIMEQIQEMRTILQNYQNQKLKLSSQYNQIKDNLHKKSRLNSIMKQLTIYRNQVISQLPIISRKFNLLVQLKKKNLIILEGETGSGKSTQLPQILCQFYNIFNDDRVKPILTTQPRKIATRSLAQRVASQLGEKIYGFVDYVASSGKKPNKNSKIIFMLDRLLLDEFQKDPLLNNYSCLVLDQAHQRTISIDIIIGQIKNLLSKRKDFKVIITSATLDSKLFETYFNTKTFKVSGRLYPVQIINKPYQQLQSFTEKIQKCIYEEILLDKNKVHDKYYGNILVFCSTVDEITKLCQKFSKQLNKNTFLIYPLHGKLTIEEQKSVFIPQPGKIKIIFTSRISQTAVTIDKVSVVIDIGWDRQITYDQKKKISSFTLKPISKSSTKQRAGRAGRTQAGYCFKLYQQQFEQNSMRKNKTAQIENMPLDTLVLRLKQLKIKDIINFEYLAKPNQQLLRYSLQSMQMIGCLDENYDITDIGRALVQIPIEPFLSRAIIEGIILQKIDKNKSVSHKIIKILSMIVNNSNLFFNNELTKQECERIKFHKFADPKGDFFSLLNIYEEFDQKSKQLDKYKLKKWCNQNYLNIKSLSQTKQLIKQIDIIKRSIQIDLNKMRQYVRDVQNKLNLFKTNNELVFSSLLSSFCQNLCLYSGNSMIGYTFINQRIPIQIYGSSFLALQGINPKWIVCYDIISTSNIYCKIAQDVDFQFLKNSLSKKMIKKYRLEECEKQNPFYKVLKFQVSTVVLNEFQIKRRVNDYNLDFLLESKVVVKKQLNTIQLYCEVTNYQQIYQKIKYLLDDLAAEKNRQYIHHYLGYISARLKQGLQIVKLNLSQNYFSVKILNVPSNWRAFLYQQFSYSAFSIQISKDVLTLTFGSQDIRQKFVQQYKQIQETIVQLKDSSIKLTKYYQERKNKIAAVWLKLRFFAAQRRNRNNLLLVYDQKDAYEMNELLKQQLPYGMACTLTKNRKGVNIFFNGIIQLDQVQFSKYLLILAQKKKLIKFKKPIRIKAFRDVDTKFSGTTINQWIKRIKLLFKEIDDQKEVHQEDINVWGFCQNKPKNGQSIYNTQLHGSVKLYDSKSAQNFKNEFDGQINKLGTQKLHVKIQYIQTIIRITQKIYNTLRDKYTFKKDILSSQNLNLKINQRLRSLPTGNYFFIQAVSEKRSDLLKPTLEITKIFQAQIIKLDQALVKLLNKKIGSKLKNKIVSDEIFERIQCLFDYKIYFQYWDNSNQIRLYCSKEQYKQVTEILMQQIKSLDKHTDRIYFRGKNIHKVKQILETNNIPYQIYFNQKYVEITGDIEKILFIKNQVEKLVNNSKADCQICCNILTLPFKLHNCNHQYCNLCFTNYIRGIKDDPKNYPILCPTCKMPVCIYDLKYLFDYEQFNKICDKAVLKIVDNKKYHICYTANCEQIFDLEKTKQQNNTFHCILCNIRYCYLCKLSSHQNYTCEQYKHINEGSKLSIKQLGIKICKKCKNGIQKNKGCNHIACTCGAHICWICQQLFDTGGECMNHLIQAHKKVFEDGVRE